MPIRPKIGIKLLGIGYTKRGVIFAIFTLALAVQKIQVPHPFWSFFNSEELQIFSPSRLYKGWRRKIFIE